VGLAIADKSVLTSAGENKGVAANGLTQTSKHYQKTNDDSR
jgi:hypothetical protein